MFAYNPPTADLRSVPWTGFFDPAEGAQVSVFDNGDEIVYIAYNDKDDIVPSDEIYFKYADAFFTTDNGKIIILESADVQPHTACSHTFEDGILHRHNNNDGGCSVKTYKGQICQQCKYTRSLSLLNVVTYSPCPH